MFLVSKSLRFIASIRQMKRRFGGQKEITGKINWKVFKHFKTYPPLRQWERISVVPACPRIVGEAGGSESGTAAPPARGGGSLARCQLGGTPAAERMEKSRLACDCDIATCHQEQQLLATTDDKTGFIVLLVSVTLPWVKANQMQHGAVSA